MTEGLRHKLAKAAEKNGRSLNAEILWRLEQTLGEPPQATLLQTLANELSRQPANSPGPPRREVVAMSEGPPLRLRRSPTVGSPKRVAMARAYDDEATLATPKTEGDKSESDEALLKRLAKMMEEMIDERLGPKKKEGES
jgi:hypothetical protein